MRVYVQFSDMVGLLGVLLILITYYFLSLEKWDAQTYRYQILNFLGAAGIFYSLLFKWNLSSAVIEIAWMGISLLGMYHIYNRRKK